jgi:hypothetical protein
MGSVNAGLRGIEDACFRRCVVPTGRPSTDAELRIRVPMDRRRTAHPSARTLERVDVFMYRGLQGRSGFRKETATLDRTWIRMDV